MLDSGGTRATCGRLARMARWTCPNCEREFGARNQAHVCSPGISVDELLSRHPDWVAEIYEAVIEPLRALGPVHEDAVNVGVFLKSDRKLGRVPAARCARCSSARRPARRPGGSPGDAGDDRAPRTGTTTRSS